MTITVYRDLEQGSEEWLQARCGVLTASTIGQLLTNTGKGAKNEKSRALVYMLMTQRIEQFVEPVFENYDMIRGHEDEVEAKLKYSQEIALVDEVGFITEDKWGFTLGYSPDGLVGDDGLIEVKSRKHHLQTQVILSQAIPAEYMAQIQTGLLVSGRRWLDFISFPALGGGKMMVMRAYPDPVMQGALVEAAAAFEAEIRQRRTEYDAAMLNGALRFFDVERRQEEEEIVI